jgi:hypothetical protein
MMTRYLRTLTLMSCVAAFAVAGATWAIDPYGYWGSKPVSGLNVLKPNAGVHATLAKPAQAVRIAPKTLLIGNSRTEVGIDPASGQWPQAMQPVYNLGLSGASLETSVDAAIAVAEKHKPETIIAGIEFLDFVVTEADWRDGAKPVAPQSFTPNPRDYAAMLFSLAAISDSAATIAGQNAKHPGTTTPQGFNGLDNYYDIVATEGHAAIFAQRNADYRKRLSRAPHQLAWLSKGHNPGWGSLNKLEEYCKAHGIRLVLHSYPYHEQLLGIFRENDLDDDFAQWRQVISGWTASRGMVFADFADFAPYNKEAVPGPGDTRTNMRYYWEAGHFKAALGDRMIENIVAAAPPLSGPRHALRPDRPDSASPSND